MTPPAVALRVYELVAFIWLYTLALGEFLFLGFDNFVLLPQMLRNPDNRHEGSYNYGDAYN